MRTMYLVSWIIAVPLYLLMLPFMRKLFVKAGRTRWTDLLPFRSDAVLYDIAGKPDTKWFAVALSAAALLPWPRSTSMLLILSRVIWILHLFLEMQMAKYLARRFARPDSFTLGLVFLPFVFYPMLALDRSDYDESRTARPEGGRRKFHA